MDLSLNEVEATAKRATRGAGYPWGLAEESAKATRWLCARDIDGCAVLARLLEMRNGSDLAEWSPQSDSDMWEAEGGVLCPIAAGTTISDRACDVAAHGIRLRGVAEPLMLLPFVAQSAQELKTTVSIEWPGVVAITDGWHLSMSGEPGLFAAEATVICDGELGTLKCQKTRAEPTQAVLQKLGRFAHRTFAPATEESRLLGAGAGLSDND